ncbi:MAG: NAD-dependent epimerase/dehydratase family protein [Alphaproteobacteria bacterium]
MKIVVTGAAGFLGRRLTKALLARDTLVGREGKPQAVSQLILADTVAYPGPEAVDGRVKVVTADITDRASVDAFVPDDVDGVFHLAAVVSAAAEADFDLGMNVNLRGTMHLLERLRATGRAPKLMFTSSIATYGGDMPPEIRDETPQTPQNSYGIQKAAGELLVSDYSRKGFIDGRSLRLPTIVVRPGKPNKAASTFASSIIREPLCGREAICPVSPDTVMPIMSPRRVVDSFLKAFELDAAALGSWRSILLPGLSVTVEEMAAALGRAGGQEAVDLIRWAPDPAIQKIVSGWPTRVAPERAGRLGIETDASMDDVIKAFIEDDLEAQKAGTA